MANKSFPQEPKDNLPKVTSGKSNFKAARKFVEFHGSTPASPCISFRETFNNQLENLNLTDEKKNKLWLNVSEAMLNEPGERLEDIIRKHIDL